MSTFMKVVTPEGVPLRIEIAGLSKRILAFFIDIVVLSLATVLLLWSCAVTSIGFGAFTVIAVFIITEGYFIFFELMWGGESPGKRLMGSKVISRDGGPLGVEAVLARNFMRKLDIFLPFLVLSVPEALFGDLPKLLVYPSVAWVFLVALLPWLNRQRTRAGDLVAGTLVVEVPAPVLLPDQAAKAGEEIRFTEKQLSIYGEYELETLATILRTADSIKVPKSELERVASTIARRIKYAGKEPSEKPLVFLRAFYKAQRAYLEKKLIFGKRKRYKGSG